MRVLIIDGNNYAYRGYWAIKEELTSSDGTPTNAVRVFFSILSTDLKVLRPTHLAVTWDRTQSYRRLKLFPGYKHGRVHDPEDRMPDQMKVIRRLLRASGIATLGVVGEEADDLIATLVRRFGALGARVLISSNDKDFAQLVTDRVSLVEARTRKLIGPKEVATKFGVPPDRMQDYLTIVGDKVDNIAGVPGIGAKTASKLLAEYKNFGSLFKAARGGALTPALCRNLIEFERSQFELSYALVKPYNKVKLNFEPERFALHGRSIDHHRVSTLCRELQMGATLSLIEAINS